MSSESAKPSVLGRPSVRGVDLTTGSVVRHLIAFSVPMLMGSAAHAAYSIINAVWVGQGLGTDAMAAVAVSFPIIFVLMAIANGLTLASNVLVSQAFGAKDWQRLREIIQNSVILVSAAGILCLVIGYFTTEPLLRAMATPPEVLPMAISYLRLFVWTIPLMFGIFLLASLMRGVGDSKTPLFFQAGSLILTAILDPLLIFGWIGFPRLGLNGTVVATMVSQAGAVVSLAVYLRRKQHIASPDWRRLRLNAQTTFLTLRIGVPSMVQQALVSLGFLFIVSMVNRFGAHSAAAYGIATRIDQLAFMPSMAIGAAASTLTGQNIGANRYDRVRQVLWWGIAVGCGITMAASILSIAIPSQLMRMFARDPDVIRIGAHYLRIVGAGYLLIAVMFVSNGVVNGAGHTLATTFFTLIGFWAVRVPLAAYLSGRLDDVAGIWYAITISLAVGMSISMAYYFTGRWKRPIRKGFR